MRLSELQKNNTVKHCCQNLRIDMLVLEDQNLAHPQSGFLDHVFTIERHLGESRNIHAEIYAAYLNLEKAVSQSVTKRSKEIHEETKYTSKIKQVQIMSIRGKQMLRTKGKFQLGIV